MAEDALLATMPEPTPPTRRRWFRSFLRTMLVVAVAAAVGFPAGWVAVVSGVHGGEAYAAIILAAPAYLLSTIAFGDTLGFVYCAVVSTSILYAIYAFVLSQRSRTAIAAMVVFHVICGVLLFLEIRSAN